MFQRSVHSMLTLLAFALTAPSEAAVLSASGTLEFSIGSFKAESAGLVPIFVSSSGGDFVQPRRMFTSRPVRVPTSIVPVLGSTPNLTVNVGTGVFSEGGGPAGGFGGAGGLEASFFTRVIRIPLDAVGRDGVGVVGAAALMITVTGHLWTTGRAEVTAVTSATPGGFVNTVALTGSDARTGGHQGNLLLLTPFRFRLNSSVLSGFASQSLYFVPEPGSLVLLMSGVFGLVLVGRARG